VRRTKLAKSTSVDMARWLGKVGVVLQCDLEQEGVSWRAVYSKLIALFNWPLYGRTKLRYEVAMNVRIC
jgi:hypothetical protein